MRERGGTVINRSFQLGAALCCGLLIAGALGQDAKNPARQVAQLRRQAFLGVSLSSPSPTAAGAQVTRITDANVAAKTGLRAGDRVMRVNGTILDTFSVFRRVITGLREGDRPTFEIKRDGSLVELNPTLMPLPREAFKGVETLYDSVVTDLGFRVRTIVTRPQNAKGKLPTVFLVGWLSCDSPEYPFGPDGDGFGQLLQDIATRSGFALIRMDKPGVGDSDGPCCADLDFNTELAAYRSAFRNTGRYEFVDPERIFVVGLSNGGGFAPLVPGESKVRGYVVAGGWAKTWLEHMMELERRRLRLSGKGPAEITDGMRGYAEFYTEYLIHKKTPQEAMNVKPHLASLWYDRPEHQYGRPAKFYHQLQDLNLAGAWERVDAPVLVLHGEYDWIMSRADHEMIAEIVNKKRPGRATFVELPKTDHTFIAFDNEERAFNDDGSGRYNETVSSLVLKFLEGNR